MGTSSDSRSEPFFGRDVTPKSLDEYLDSAEGYDGNNVYWSKALGCAAPKGGPRFEVSDHKFLDTAKFETTLNERIDKNWPTLANVAYAKQTFGSHWIVVVGRMHDGNHLMNDPGTNSGNGAATQSDENIIQKTKRQGGYSIVRLCLFKVI